MLSGWGKAGTGTGFSISAGRSLSKAATLLAEECPGWEVSYQAHEGRWIGRRRAGLLVCDDTSDPRSVVVTATDFVALYLDINVCSLGIILAGFPDWQLACNGVEYTWSAKRPAMDGHGGHTVHDSAPAGVLHRICLHMAGIGQDDQEPWLLRLSGGRDEC